MPTETIWTLAGVFAAYGFFAVTVIYADLTSTRGVEIR